MSQPDRRALLRGTLALCLVGCVRRPPVAPVPLVTPAGTWQALLAAVAAKDLEACAACFGTQSRRGMALEGRVGARAAPGGGIRQIVLVRQEGQWRVFRW